MNLQRVCLNVFCASFLLLAQHSFAQDIVEIDTAPPPIIIPESTTNPSIDKSQFKVDPVAPPKPTLELSLTPSDSFVPPGFESLNEPQTTLVDIYFAGQFLASQIATFSAKEITLSKPEEIVKNIPYLKNGDLVLSNLTGPITTNLDSLCQYQGQRDCGKLAPEVSGVIFDENRFRADLFINPDFFTIKNAGIQKFLPASDSGWSWLQSMNAAYSGITESKDENYTLNSNSTFAYQENRLQIIGSVQNDGINNIDTAVISRDWQGKEYQLGYFRSNSGSFQFMGDSPIRGIRLASSLKTREDLRQTAGNELKVFLAERSEVLLFKDGRLISSRFYDQGNQILDTTQLPDGAYDITIQIRESGDQTREETRFYVKTTQLPPTDQALYFFEAGELLNLKSNSGFANNTGLTLLRGGYHDRLSDQFGILAGLSQVEDNYSLELGLTHIGRFHQFSMGAFSGNDSKIGGSVNLRTQFSNFFVNANIRKVTNNNYDPDDLSDFIGESSAQSSLTVSTALPFGRFELSARTNRRNNETLKNYSSRFEFPRMRVGVSEMLSGITFSRENGVNFGLMTLELRLNGKHFTAQLQPEYAINDSNNNNASNDFQTRGVVSWHDRDIYSDKDLRVDVRARNQSNQNSYGAEMDLATQSGRARLQAEHIQKDDQSSTRINGSAFTSFLLNDSTAKLGSRDQSQSAVLIKVSGELTDASFDVLVNGNPRGIAYPNKTLAVNLRPYERYQVQLRPRGSSFVDYDQKIKDVTLYPGNIVTLEWEASELEVVFGQMFDENGFPIANALISGVSGFSTTDDDGLFQAEIRRGTKTINIETIEASCEVDLPSYKSKNGIGALGKLKCSLIKKQLNAGI
ncbi:CS1-pili formation C-terminal domain-containing protein [Aurantivibrio infirmus]